MVSGVKRALRVSLLVVPPLDVTRCLAIQETDNQLVDGRVPIVIGVISVIAKIGFNRLFPRSLEGPV